MEELISVSVTLGERKYPLKIKAGNEELVSKAEQLINEKFNEFQLRFTGQEKIDYLAMSALMNLVDLLKNNNSEDKQLDLMFHKISESEHLISEALKKSSS